VLVQSRLSEWDTLTGLLWGSVGVATVIDAQKGSFTLSGLVPAAVRARTEGYRVGGGYGMTHAVDPMRDARMLCRQSIAGKTLSGTSNTLDRAED
jgi:hypothetical protein